MALIRLTIFSRYIVALSSAYVHHIAVDHFPEKKKNNLQSYLAVHAYFNKTSLSWKSRLQVQYIDREC